MRCNKCNKDIPASSKFCPECGIKIEPVKNIYCIECGTKLLNGAKFCINCGKKVLIYSPSNLEDNKITKSINKTTPEENNNTDDLYVFTEEDKIQHDNDTSFSSDYQDDVYEEEPNPIEEFVRKGLDILLNVIEYLLVKISRLALYWIKFVIDFFVDTFNTAFGKLNESNIYGEVSKDENPDETRNKKKKIILYSLLALLIIGSIILSSDNSEPVSKPITTVPSNNQVNNTPSTPTQTNNQGQKLITMVNVTNMSYYDAVEALHNIGLYNITSDIDSISDKTNYIVSYQNVIKGSQITKNHTIFLICENSDGTVEPEDKPLDIKMANVIGKTLAEAINELEKMGFTNISSNVSADEDKDSYFVTSQSIDSNTNVLSNEPIILTCKKEVNLYLDIKSIYNLIFYNYDIDIILDGTQIGTVSNGDNFTYLSTVIPGKHKIEFINNHNPEVFEEVEITVKNDMTYSCEIMRSSTMSILAEKTINNINGASLEVINVTGQILADANKSLEEIGFSNITAIADSTIFNYSNWLVVKQNIEPGTKIDKATPITLECINLDDHFENLFVDKNVNEIEKIASEHSITLKYVNEDSVEIDDKIESYSEEINNDWIAVKARRYGGTNDVAVITLKYNGNQKLEEEAPIVDNDKNEAKSPSYYSGTKEEAKQGKSGVYAYARDTKAGYTIYYIIDFDENYVYRFIDGNGEATCDKLKIDSGTLNDVVIVTYHDGNNTWSNGLHFQNIKQPDRLILEDNNHIEYVFVRTNLKNALALRNTKKIHNY